MMYKRDEAQWDALAKLKAAADVFISAIVAFDNTIMPKELGGNSEWIEHIQDVLFEIEAEIDMLSVDYDAEDEE
jgi:hypothetical protein